jgi:hypothetical protein
VIASKRSSPSVALFDRARAAFARAAAEGPVTISRQLLREYLSVMTRAADVGKAVHPLTGCCRYCGVSCGNLRFSRMARRCGNG